MGGITVYLPFVFEGEKNMKRLLTALLAALLLFPLTACGKTADSESTRTSLTGTATAWKFSPSTAIAFSA